MSLYDDDDLADLRDILGPSAPEPERHPLGLNDQFRLNSTDPDHKAASRTRVAASVENEGKAPRGHWTDADLAWAFVEGHEAELASLEQRAPIRAAEIEAERRQAESSQTLAAYLRHEEQRSENDRRAKATRLARAKLAGMENPR